MRTSLTAIPTKQPDGKANGVVLPIWRADSGETIAQVYLTTIEPGTVKGPHLHMRRCGRFTCIKGDIEVTVRLEDGTYATYFSGEKHGYATVFVAPGLPARLRCLSDTPAMVLNMPTPAWSKEDQDEWTVEEWDPR